MKRSLIWLRNDLRLHDNEALNDAIKHSEEIVPVYIIDPRIFRGSTKFGFRKTNVHRCKFLLESLKDLRESLKSIGSNLYVREGYPEIIIPKLARKLKTNHVNCNRERTDEEVKVQDELERNLWAIGQEVRYYRGKMLYYTADLPFPITHCPDQFTSFRKEVEKIVPIREPLELPTTKLNGVSVELAEGKIPDLEAFDFVSKNELKGISLKGGETEALKLLNSYIWDSENIRGYNKRRNELLGMSYSSKLSPYLSAGCISPKLVYKEIKNFEKETDEHKSSYSLILDLYMRDFLRFMCKKYGNKIFQLHGINNNQDVPKNENLELFEKWKTGNTGVPFVDANMRELKETGFMSNRGRQNVASFLVRDLNINWVLGAEYFESQLIDYDPCSNYGNWNIVAGVGSDSRADRYFNISAQARKYDPKCEYIRYWLPELQEVDMEYLFNPFSNSNNTNALPQNYPQPCLAHVNW